MVVMKFGIVKILFLVLTHIFLEKTIQKKKISYGASVGTTNYDNNNNIEQIKNCLARFEKISVRDKSSQNLVRHCVGINPPIVLDPCFLVNIDTIIKKKIDYDFENEKYILIYGDYFHSHQIDEIKKISRKNKWNIISISFYNNWADKNFISADPIDLIQFIINSNLVFTSMFHGVMLSYKYKKQFWISEDPYRINKLSYFVDYFGLKKRYLENIDKSLIDYKNYDNKFSDLLNLSKNFLIKNIYYSFK